MMSLPTGRQFKLVRSLAVLAAAIGVAGLVAGAVFDMQVFYQSYLIAFMYWLGLPLGACGLMMIHRMSGGEWGRAIAGVCEASARTMPLFILLFVPLIFATTVIYPWTQLDSAGHMPHELESKAPYLNLPFFYIRAAIYFAVWTIGALVLARGGERQRATGDTALDNRLLRLAPPGLIVYVFTMTFAAVDWVMSLEPQWFSTIYGLVFIVGQGLAALALSIAVLTGMMTFVTPSSPREAATRIPRTVLHDLSKLLFASISLTAYIAFSQFLIIWYANLPEETRWYWPRTHTNWNNVAIVLIAGYFAVPFVVLLSRQSKRAPRIMFVMSLFLLVMHFVEILWLIAPAFPDRPMWAGATDVAAWLAIGGVWVLLFLHRFARSKPQPVTDPLHAPTGNVRAAQHA
ncbi:MAG: hypothetical protein WD042_14410 [Phycisphaeraceae bacterium]